MPEYVPSLTKVERQWLKELEIAIWKTEELWDSLKRRHVPIRKVARTCTRPELDQLFALVRLRNLVCELEHYGSFDGVRLDLYEHAPDPEADPEYLFTVCHQHLPGDGPPRSKFQAAFDLFGAVARTELNLHFLKFYKLEPPKDIGHYLY